MIHFFLLISRQGKTRLTKWYQPQTSKEKVSHQRRRHNAIPASYFVHILNNDDLRVTKPARMFNRAVFSVLFTSFVANLFTTLSHRITDHLITFPPAAANN